MIRLCLKTALTLTVVAPLLVCAVELPECVELAATEFDVPAKVFKALAIQGAEKTVPRPEQHFGPMGIHNLAIKVAAEGIGATTEEIKTDSCMNYRAAAWWLSVPAGGNDSSDIWLAVNRYFYGKTNRSTYPITERVKEIHSQLN